MKIYCGRNRKGVWKASTDITKIQMFNDLFSCNVDVIHNNRVYMLRTYYGFDYGLTSMNDVVEYVRKCFHSVSEAKKDETWKEKEKLSTESPNEYHVTPFSIASDDNGVPFEFGDVMENKFNIQIISVRVI